MTNDLWIVALILTNCFSFMLGQVWYAVSENSYKALYEEQKEKAE